MGKIQFSTNSTPPAAQGRLGAGCKYGVGGPIQLNEERGNRTGLLTGKKHRLREPVSGD